MEYGFDRIAYLLLDVTLGRIDWRDAVGQSFLFSLVAMMQSVSLFKVPEDGKASPFGEVAVNPYCWYQVL